MKRLAHRIKWWYRERFVLPKLDAARMRAVLRELRDILQDDWEDPLQWEDLPIKARKVRCEAGYEDYLPENRDSLRR